MPKAVVVAGIVGVGLLAGCVGPGSSPERIESEARFICEHMRNIEVETPEMDECMAEMVPVQAQAHRDAAAAAAARPADSTRPDPLIAIRATCLNRYGHSPDTPELAQCIQQLDLERQRQTREGWQALGQTLSSMAPSTTSCNTTYGGGFARTNCY